MKKKEIEEKQVDKIPNKHGVEIFLIPLVFFLSLFILVLSKKDLKDFTSAQSLQLEKGGSIVSFKDVDFYVYKVNRKSEKLKLWLKDDNDNIYKNIGRLKKDLEKKGEEELIFAMNAGMYTRENLPQGLFKSENKKIIDIDKDTFGYGNFYMYPNGVFAFNENSVLIETTLGFMGKIKKYKNATQSGPMLVINGDIHPKFNENSKSKHIRNGVGIDKDKKIIFACSSQPVNLYHFADLFKTLIGCDNALYLDGAISKVYIPEISKLDISGNLGPIIGVTKPIKKRKQNKKTNKITSNSKFKQFIFSPSMNKLKLYSDYQANYLNVISKDLLKSPDFLMLTNGGSFKKNSTPEGLLIKEKKIIFDINLEDGKGNFYLKPNGVLYKEDNKFKILESNEFYNNLKDEEGKIGNDSKTINIDFAIQSGPLLVNNGVIHQAFRKDSKNRKIRNGVGICPNGDLVFLLSKEPVNFYAFAEEFKENYSCGFALCLDSNISFMCTKENTRDCLNKISKQNYGYFLVVE